VQKLRCELEETLETEVSPIVDCLWIWTSLNYITRKEICLSTTIISNVLTYSGSFEEEVRRKRRRAVASTTSDGEEVWNFP